MLPPTPVHAELLADVARAALRAVDPRALTAAAIDVDQDWLRLGDAVVARTDRTRVHVVAAGKASVGMAEGALERLDGHVRVTGTVLAVREDVVPLGPLQVVPVRSVGRNRPTEAAVRSTRAVMRDVAELGEHDVLLALLSGGGSAMLCAPLPGTSLAELDALVDGLERRGADIGELNAARRRHSAVKGGGLARAAVGAGTRAALLLSDVDDDDPAVVASGPLTDVAGDGATPPSTATVIGSAEDMLRAAVLAARERGIETELIGRGVSGSTSDVVRRHLRSAGESGDTGELLVVSAGENTVRLPARPGEGGRATHLLLALAQALHGAGIPRWTAATIASDGEDAGGHPAAHVLDARAHGEMLRAGIDVEASLRNADSAAALRGWATPIDVHGPRRTNVGDLRLVLCGTRADDAARWDTRHAADEHRRGGGPTAFLAESVELLPTRGRALDLACGDGGDVVFLAERGLHAVGLDVSPVAVDKARRLAAERGVTNLTQFDVCDLSLGVPADLLDLDLVCLTHYHDPGLRRIAWNRLAIGGLLLVETATTENLERGFRAPSRRWLARPGELLEPLPGMRVRRYDEREIDGMVRARLLAEKIDPAVRGRAGDEHPTDGAPPA